MTSIIQDIKPDFDRVISYSQNIANPKTQVLLESWYAAKKDIIKAMGNKLIVESGEPITLYLSEEARESRLNEFIDIVEYNYNNEALASFLEYCRKDFFTNHLSEDYARYGIRIPKGTKIVRAFKYFEDHESVLQELQTRASMIIQENSVTGTFCISVHPLDFLSASENTHKWRSCHALDGEYRSGNLSYMCDKSTIMCYLKSDSELHKLPSFPEDVKWNSKKWRMWLFLEDNREALFAGRQYPFFSESGLTLAKEFYINYCGAKSHHWSKWYDDFIIDFPRKENSASRRDRNLYNGRNVMLRGRVYGMVDLVQDVKNPLHFNDLIYSTCYVPYYCWNYYPSDDSKPLHFSIGSSVACLECGKAPICEGDGGSMKCWDCEMEVATKENRNFVHCVCCDRRMVRINSYYGENVNGWLCEECLQNETSECDNCGEVWYNVDIVYDREKKKHLCPCCRGERERNNAFYISDDDWMALPF